MVSLRIIKNGRRKANELLGRKKNGMGMLSIDTLSSREEYFQLKWPSALTELFFPFIALQENTSEG